MSFNILFGITILVFLSSPICFGKRVVKEKLNPQFYHKSCPQAETIVQDITWKHVKENPSLAAKILRVHYHDCFVRVCMIQNPRVYIYIILLEYLILVTSLSLCIYMFWQGCDASVLLDSVGNNTAEKDAPPNRSLSGYEVIDEIKSTLEEKCPNTVSCADIVALSARDAVSFQARSNFWNIYIYSHAL